MKDQLSFSFVMPVKIKSPQSVKILSRPAPLSNVNQQIKRIRWPNPSDDTRIYLHQQNQIDKYEKRITRLVWIFFLTALLTVLSKSGIPIVEELLKQHNLPPLENSRLIRGILGSAVLVSAGLIIFNILRSSELSYQLQLALQQRTTYGIIAELLLKIGWFILACTLIAVIYLTVSDILFTFGFLWNHSLYIMEGWDPIKH